MIKAEEVLEMTREAVNKKYESHIREAASRGKRSVEIYGEISEDEISILREYGYSVVVEEREARRIRDRRKSIIKW